MCFSLFCPLVCFESLTSCRDRMITRVFAKVHEYVKIFLTSTKLPRPLNRFGESCTVSSLLTVPLPQSTNIYHKNYRHNCNLFGWQKFKVMFLAHRINDVRFIKKKVHNAGSLKRIMDCLSKRKNRVRSETM